MADARDLKLGFYRFFDVLLRCATKPKTLINKGYLVGMSDFVQGRQTAIEVAQKSHRDARAL
jgi:hypothetical protein